MEKKILIMYLAMVSNIVFPANARRGELKMTRVSSVKIESSYEMLTDTATIIIPKASTSFVKTPVGDLLRRGDAVKIQLGYNTTYHDEFEGIIDEVSSDAPIEIRCEDNMWKLKRIMKSVSVEDVKLLDLVKAIVPSEFTLDVMDVVVGSFSKKNSSVAGILKEITHSMGLYSYFKGSTLVVGKIFTDDIEAGNRVRFDFEQNVRENNLVFKKAEDRKITIEAKSVEIDGSSISVKVGDEDGELRSLVYIGVDDEDELKKLASEDLKKFKVDGFIGDLKTFGSPLVRHGYIAELRSSQYPERKGDYFVSKVVTEFNDSPMYQRTLTLSQKAS